MFDVIPVIECHVRLEKNIKESGKRRGNFNEIFSVSFQVLL